MSYWDDIEEHNKNELNKEVELYKLKKEKESN